MAKNPPKQGSNRTGIKSGQHAQKTGPKPKIIDWDEVRKLGQFHCTLVEVAAFLNVNEDSLNKMYMRDFPGQGTIGEFIATNRLGGKTSLRRTQYNLAVNEGNVQMLIHLGKYYLDQRDVPAETKLIANNITITEDNVDEWIKLAK